MNPWIVATIVFALLWLLTAIMMLSFLAAYWEADKERRELNRIGLFQAYNLKERDQ